MRAIKLGVIAGALAIGLLLAIGVGAQRARPMAFSPPPQVQSESFSVSTGSPITATGVLPADVLGGDEGPIVLCEDLGLLCQDPIGPALDDVKGLSYGYDFVAQDLPPVQFSVAKNSQGLPNTAVRVEANCVPAEVQADVFETALDGANEQDLDGNGTACGTNAGFGLGLDESATGDNVDEIERDPCQYVDIDCDGQLDEPVYVTLSPGSPTLAELGATSADILVTSAEIMPQIWASGVAQLGLVSGDVIDAVCVYDDGDTVFGAGDRVLFSLAAGSPTLLAWSASPADVLQPRGVRYTAAMLGLLAADDVDGLACAAELPTFKLYMPILTRNFAAP